MVSRRVMAAALAVAALALAGCGSGGDDGPAGGGTLIDAEDQAPPILNVLLAEGVTVTAQRIVSNVLQNLLTVDDDGPLRPAARRGGARGRRPARGAAARDLPHPPRGALVGRRAGDQRATSSSPGAR